MTHPQGAFAPIPTPVGDDGLLEPLALERHLGLLSRGGVDGVLVMGTNGEFPSFDMNERMALAEAVARVNPGLQLMLGVGSCATPEVIHLLQTAAYFGYASALLPPPFYFRSAPTEGLVSFFKAALDGAPVPVLLYHIPQVTGVPISDEILDAISDHPRFGGVKDSSGDENELRRLTDRLGNHTYMVGHDRLLSLAAKAGGNGSITASASVVPALVAATHRDAHRQPELDAVRSLLDSYGLGPAVKALLRDRAVGAYRTRPPLVGLDDATAAELVAEFNALTTS